MKELIKEASYDMGMKDAILGNAKKMLADNMEDDLIIKYSGISKEQLNELKNEK